MKLQLSTAEEIAQRCEKQPAEQAGQNADGEEEPWAAGDPGAIGAEASPGCHGVDVRVMEQVLAPGMKEGKEADPGAEVLGIGGDGQQRLRTGVEQKLVEAGLVLQRQRVELLGNREDDVEVFDGQQFGSAPLDPLGPLAVLAFGAVAVAARVVADALLLTVVAAVDMAAESGSAAGLDGPHHAVLLDGQPVALPVLAAEAAEDVGHLEGGAAQRGVRE